MQNNTQIPFAHTDNLNSLKKLDSLGFEGADASLEISLAEYGLAWCIDPDDEEMLFVYSLGRGDGSFDRAGFDPEIDFKSEFDWVGWDDLLATVGMSWEEWGELPMPWKIGDLVMYYGVENVFGSSYWEGFKIDGLGD